MQFSIHVCSCCVRVFFQKNVHVHVDCRGLYGFRNVVTMDSVKRTSTLAYDFPGTVCTLQD